MDIPNNATHPVLQHYSPGSALQDEDEVLAMTAAAAKNVPVWHRFRFTADFLMRLSWDGKLLDMIVDRSHQRPL